MNATTNITVKNPPKLIDSVRIPGVEGLIGITSCPGMREEYVFDLYSESLIDDLQALRAWGAVVVVTLLEDTELHSLGVRDLGKNIVALNMIWLHLPVHNMGLPDERFEDKWRVVAPCLCNLLQEGKRLVIHCREGIGRAGLVAVRLLLELGLAVDEAIRIVRKARPGSIMLASYEKYCYELAVAKVEGAGGRPRDCRFSNY